MNIKTKPIAYGISGSLILFVFYLVLLTILNSFNHAISQFFSIWYLMIPLIIGFGIQIGLFVHIKDYHKHIGTEKATLGVSAGVSGGAMVACCTHHFAEIFALMGIAGASVFFAKYQTIFLLMGIGANIFGIIYMLNELNKAKSCKKIAKRNKKKNNFKINPLFIVAGLVVLLLGFSIFTTVSLFKKNSINIQRQVSGSLIANENKNPELDKYRSLDIPEECRLPDYNDDVHSWMEHLSHHKNTWYCLDYFEGGQELIGK